MSGFLNKATLIGNLGQDPEIRTTQSGSRIVTLSIATSEKWMDNRSGDRRERTEWHRIVIFNEPLGALAEKYLKKGAKVYVEGSIRTRKWQDQSGADRYSTEIHLGAYNATLIFLDRKQDNNRPASGGDAVPEEPAGAGAGSSIGSRDMDDDIPFAPCWQ